MGYDLEDVCLEKNIDERCGEKRFSGLIHYCEQNSLSNVPYHQDVSCITRFFAEKFPLHLAIHQVHAAKNETRTYTDLHTHECDEINILIGEPGQLTYIIQLGDEVYNVDSCSCIWIPAGLPHSANVLEGAGSYVALRLHGQSTVGYQGNSLKDYLVSSV